MGNPKTPYNAYADIRIQMLGSDAAAFAVGRPPGDAPEDDSRSSGFHAHVYLEDGSWEVRIFDAADPPQPTFATVEAAIGHAVLTALSQTATGEPGAGNKALDTLAPRARTPAAAAACG